MAKPPNETLALRLVYRGGGPVHWSGGPGEFGVQDKDNALTLGAPGDGDALVFDITVGVKPGAGPAPVLVGPFAHGPPTARFLYLSWRNATGEYAQRFKLTLSSIAWSDIEAARVAGRPLTGEIVDRNPRATSTGANIGGTRAIAWTAVSPEDIKGNSGAA